jgi:hypothetical protein
MSLKEFLVDIQFYSILPIAYFAVVLFPGNYVALDAGLDPSWRYAINYLPHSAEVFGRDVVFTYGPLGYFLVPLNVGSNLVYATLFHVLMHMLLVLILIDYAFRRRRVAQTIFLVVSFSLAPLVGLGLSNEYEYSYLVLTAVLIALSYENDRFSVVADFISAVLASLFLFMKFSLGVSAILMIALVAIMKLLRKQKNSWRSALIVGGTLLATTTIIALSYCGSPRAFCAWLITSWHMADGYSVAMSLSAAPHIVVWALFGVAAYLTLLILLRIYESPLFYIALIFAIAIFFCFKHSFVRQDAQHLLYFFPFLLSLVGILGLNARGARELRFAAYGYLVISILALPNANEYHFLSYSRINDQLSGSQGLRNLSALINLNGVRKTLNEVGRSNLEAARLAPGWAELIGEHNGRVGTLPSEVSYVPANNLRWDPFPALQTYNAHQSSLDQWCSEHYAGSQAPDFLLISFHDIDGRNLLLSTPATWRKILGNYVLFRSEPEKEVQLFKRRAQPVPSNLAIIGHQTARFSEWITVPPSARQVYAFPQMRLRLLGWASKTLYHVPPVSVILTYASGRYASYRVIPDTAQNGLLMNYLPTDKESFDQLFANTATDRVVRFKFSGPGVSYYNQEFELTWKEDQTSEIRFAPERRVNIGALSPIEGSPLFGINLLNNQSISTAPAVVDANKDAITILGWAVDPAARKSAGAVFVDIDGMDIQAKYPTERMDIAAAQNNPAYAHSGFSASFPISLIGKGKHTLSLKIVTNALDGYYQSTPGIALEVK